MLELRELPLENVLSRTFRADLGILFIRWKRKASSEQLREAYLHCLNEGAPLRNRFWFLDLRQRGAANPEDEQWILNAFFPLLENTIPGSHYFAYLVSPTHQNAIDRTVGLLSVADYSEHTKIQVFNAENHAINWLREMRQTEAEAVNPNPAH